MLDLGECLLLDTDNSPSAVHPSSVKTQEPSSDGYFVYLFFRVRQVQTFGGEGPKQK